MLVNQAEGNLLLPLFSSLMDIAINGAEGSLRKSAFGVLSSFYPAVCERGNLSLSSAFNLKSSLTDMYF